MEDKQNFDKLYHVVSLIAVVFIIWQLFGISAGIDWVQIRVERNYETILANGSKVEDRWLQVDRRVAEIEARMASIERTIRGMK